MTDIATTTPAAESSAPNTPEPSTAAPKRTFAHVRTEEIARNPANPRRHFPEGALAEMAQSIRAQGILQPIAVRRADVLDPDDPARPCRYELILGERRWRGARLASLAEMPAMVFEGVTRSQALEMALVENLQREDMNAIEEAEGLAGLKGLGLTQEQIAERVGMSRARVANALRLLELPDTVQAYVRAGALSQAHGEALLRFKPFPKVLEAIACLAVKARVPSAALEKGLPFAHDLERAEVIKLIDDDDLAEIGLDYHDARTLKELKALPWTRVFKGPNTWSDDELYALDLVAWQAWNAQRKSAHDERLRQQAAERQAARQPKARDSAAASAAPAEEKAPPPPLVQIGAIGHGKYRLLADLDAAIRRQIPPEKIEVGKHPWKRDEIVEFTRDVKLVEGLQRAASAKKNKILRARLDTALEVALENIKAIPSVASEDLAVLAGWLLGDYHTRKQVGEALALIGAKTSELPHLEPVQIIKAVLIARLRGQWQEARKYAHPMPADLQAYAKGWEKRFKERQAAEETAKKEKAAAKTPKAKKKTAAKPSAKKSNPERRRGAQDRA